MRVSKQHVLRSMSVSVAVSGILMPWRVSRRWAISSSALVGIDTLIMATLRLSLTTRSEGRNSRLDVGLCIMVTCANDMLSNVVACS
jgi:hypothetical protein